MSHTNSDRSTLASLALPHGTDWYSYLADEVKAELSACMTPRHYQPGQTIYLAGDREDSMFRIVSGTVRIHWVFATGKDVLMVVYGPGRCIGTISVLDGMPRHNDAVAQTAVSLEMLRAADFHRIAQRHPLLYKAVAVDFGRWIRDMHTMFVGGFSLEERLAKRLDALLDCGAARELRDGTLQIEFTQEMLASSIAVSRQAISKLLQDWQSSRLIDYRYKTLVVLDRARLQQIAGRPASSGAALAPVSLK